MPPDNKPDDKAFHWRREDTQLDLSIAEFVKTVFEDNLQVRGPFGGYLYAMKHTTEGEEMIRAPNNPWYLWQYRQVCTQDNVAGGHLVCTITAPTGQVIRLVAARWLTTGNRAINGYVYDVDNNPGPPVGLVGAVSAANYSIPALGGASTASDNTLASLGLLISGGSYLRLQVTSAAQTETATIWFEALLPTSTRPTVSWALSAGTPNAAAATEDTVSLVAML